MAQKTVKFFHPIYVHQDGSREAADSDFWKDAHVAISALSSGDRTVTHNAAQYFGQAGTGTTRSYPYIRVGRIRYRADWPETIDPAGAVDELILEGKDIFEGGYIVPFGTQTTVAILGPIRGLVTTTAIETWLTQVLGLATSNVSVVLVPEVDPALARKLAEAEGASRLSVRMEKGSALEASSPSEMDSAFLAALDASGDDLNVELTFSFGHQRPMHGRGGVLKKTAMWIAESHAAERVDVSLILPDGDGFKVEQHDLVRDRVAFSVKLDVDDDGHVGPDQALDAVHEAIRLYRDM